MATLSYIAPRTIARFAKSEAFGRVITGPVGSGKTTGCILELTRRALEQPKAPDGYRYTRFAIVRQTLKQLKDTVLKDCQQWLDPIGGKWKVSEGVYHLDFEDVRCEMPFIPLEDAEDQARLLSMQLTGSWLSECIEMDIGVLSPISGRLGRYPSGNRGTPRWFGLIADTNMPTELTPWHAFLEGLPPNWQKFNQPSGLSPEAENLNYLVQTDESIKLPVDHPARLAQGRKYYERFVETEGEDSDWVRRYVKAEYGDDPSGLAVFKASFRSDFHIIDGDDPKKWPGIIPGYPLVVGQDFGRNPWSLICQPDHMGRVLVHAEVPATNIGLEKHVNEHLRPVLTSNQYLGCKVAVVGDPAGVAKGSIAEESCFDALGRLGLPAIPAPTNDIEPRLRAVEAFLTRQTNGGPTLLINRRTCPMLCRAMSGGYRFTKTKQGGLRVVPEKNDKEGYSHVVDCLQYVCLVVHGNMMGYIAQRLRGKSKPRGPRPNSKGWT
jgi:hypothetical protein